MQSIRRVRDSWRNPPTNQQANPVIQVVGCDSETLGMRIRTFRAGQKTGQVGGKLRIKW